MNKSQLPQIELTVNVNAPATKVWALINNSEGLPTWNPSMKNVKVISTEKSALNEIRKCEVKFGNKSGIVTEKCIEYIPDKKISRLIQNDSFGMIKLLKEFWFSEEIDEISKDITKYTFKMYYKPVNFLISIINSIMMKKKMAKNTISIINTMKKTAERK